jgi:release factor glutamine methyltransferase
MCAATGLERIELYTHFDEPMEQPELDVLHDGLTRRVKGEPLQYILGHAPFRHLEVVVRPGVLIPRPETEQLVELVQQAIGVRDDEDTRILDIGTGTGCIALSLAQELPGAHVTATDISDEAITLACENANTLELQDRTEFIRCDIADAIGDDVNGTFDVVVSNPPYIPAADINDLPKEVGGFEPMQALDGGVDGLDTFRRIVPQAWCLLRDNGMLACELHEDNVQNAADALREHGGWCDVSVHKDLTGRERFVTARRCLKDANCQA